MAFDHGSEATGNRYLYIHWPVWYQAWSGGFVEFNFAFFLPAVVRYIPGQEPNLPLLIDSRPDGFRHSQHGGDRYGAFFLRGGSPADVAAAFDGACVPRLRAEQGAWRLYDGCGAR